MQIEKDVSIICTFHRSFGVGSSCVTWVWKSYASDIFGWVACMYVSKEKSIGVWIQLWCISCLHVSMIGQIEKGASSVDKVNSILLGLFFLSIGIQFLFLFVSFFLSFFRHVFPRVPNQGLMNQSESFLYVLHCKSYILHVRSRMTEGSYSTMFRSNGCYRGRAF
jgi:hypothetical protein